MGKTLTLYQASDDPRDLLLCDGDWVVNGAWWLEKGHGLKKVGEVPDQDKNYNEVINDFKDKIQDQSEEA